MPFDLWTWLLILATFVICGLIYNWMEVQNHDSDRQELHGAPIETIFFSALTFMGDIKFSPSTNYARLFVISLAVWRYVIHILLLLIIKRVLLVAVRLSHLLSAMSMNEL
jgi:hypothetical protein